MRIITTLLLLFAMYAAVGTLDKLAEDATLSQQMEGQDLHKLVNIVPCDTDMDCLEKNPHIQAY